VYAKEDQKKREKERKREKKGTKNGSDEKQVLQIFPF
jgi:hypothetical protein